MKWKNIWNNRNVTEKDTILQNLIALNGFESGAGAITESEWIKYTNYIDDKLDTKKGEGIFEYGCGCGALLWQFYNTMNVGGCDYSKVLIENAKKYMVGEFYLDSVYDVKPIKKYQYAISNSVFQYFPSYDYAETVIQNMINTAEKKIAILDVNDAEKKQYAEDKRRGMLSKKEYDKKYKNLDHRYYEKTWWVMIAQKYNCEIEIENQVIDNYGNADFRYNIFLTKQKK